MATAEAQEAQGHVAFGNKMVEQQKSTAAPVAAPEVAYSNDANIKMRNAELKKPGAAHPPIDAFLQRVKEKQKNCPSQRAGGGRKDSVEPQLMLDRPIFQIARGEQDYMTAKMQPVNASCKEHRFCGVRAGRLIQRLDEEYPMCPAGLFFRGKSAEGYQKWLARNFYQRGIQYKKQMLKDGTLPPDMKFEDDNVRRYDPRWDPKRAEKGTIPAGKDARDYPQTSASHSWQDASDKFSKEARDLKKAAQPAKTVPKRKGGKVQNLNASHTNLNTTQELGGTHGTQPQQQLMGTAAPAGTVDPSGADYLGASTQQANTLAMNNGADPSQLPTLAQDRQGMPTSIDEVRTAEERLYFVENQKKLTEESREDEKEKPRYADECVDYPRDPPRDDVKCCHSKLHETLQKIQINRKFQAKEAIVTLTKKEQLAQHAAQIEKKAEQTVGRAIHQAMLHYYGPLTQKKREEIKQASSEYSSRRNGPFSQSLGASWKSSGLMKVKVPEHAASLARVKPQRSEQSDKPPQNARRDTLVTTGGAEAAVAAETTSPTAQWSTRKSPEREFLDKMHRRCRFVNDQHLFYQQKAAKDTEPAKRDFADVIQSSSLQMLKQEDIDLAKLESEGGVVRQRLRIEKAMSPGAFGSAGAADREASGGPEAQGGAAQQDSIAGLARFVSDENAQRIRNCRNILQNQRLYAETILVNAKTGKQLKPHVQAALANQANGRAANGGKAGKSVGGFLPAQVAGAQSGQAEASSATARKKPTVFEQYQGQLNIESQKQRNANNRLLSKKIATCLSHSKRYQLSQMTEDFGIQRYLQKQYRKYFQTENEEAGAEIAPQKLEELKSQYFQKILDDLKSKKSDMPEAAIYEKIVEVDRVAKDIYVHDVLEKSQGLKAKGGKMEAYQFDQDLAISNKMIGEHAVNEEKEKARGLATLGKTAVATGSSKAEKEAAGKAAGAGVSKAEAAPAAASRAEEKATEAVPRSAAGKRAADDNQSLVTSLRSDELVTNGPDSYAKAASGKDPKATLYAAESSSKGQQHQQRAGQAASSKYVPGTGSGETSQGSKYRSQILNAAAGANQKSVQQVYLDSDYWYHKGVVLNQKGENVYALNCYMQALKLNADHRASIFNLACAYERLSRFEESLEGFQHAIDVDEKWPDAHYGLALCCLQLRRYQDAVKHITNAKKWSIEEYKKKVHLRQERENERRKALAADLEAGNVPPQFAAAQGTLTAENAPISLLCPENDDPTDEHYIDEATKRNDGVSTHIMYVRALCHREVKDYKIALESYARVMLRQNEICNYEKMIEEVNFQDLALKSVDGPGFPGWQVCLYSHFKRLDLLKENNRLMMVDLRPYYQRKEGWIHDRIPDVIKDLQLIRFFNRFDRETLYQMMKKTDLRVIRRHELLFLEPKQCAIIINGNLNLFSHKLDVAVPSLQAIYNPGDIIGNSAIDGGWSRQSHSWIIAYQECDILVINEEYIDYLWDKMKSSSEVNFIAEKMQATPWFKNMTEQTIYTMAFDLLLFKKFNQGDKICPQHTKSVWNVEYIFKRKDAVDRFQDKRLGGTQAHRQRDKVFTAEDLQQIYKSERNPDVKNEVCEEREEADRFRREYTADLNIRKGKGWTKAKNKQGEDGSIGSNRSLDRDGAENEDEEDEENAEAEGQDKGIPVLNVNNYLPQDKEELAKLTQKERDAIEARVRARQPAFARQVSLSRREETRARGLVAMGHLMIEKLARYQKDKASLPTDSDGLYILIEGSVTVKNDFHTADADGTKGLPKQDLMDEWAKRRKTGVAKPKNQKSQGDTDRPGSMDVLGAEKFLQVQGFSYYGSTYATAEKKGGTTCGFIRKELLHLIPFYDLYALKRDLETRYKGFPKSYGEITKELYEHALRTINRGDK